MSGVESNDQPEKLEDASLEVTASALDSTAAFVPEASDSKIVEDAPKSHPSLQVVDGDGVLVDEGAILDFVENELAKAVSSSMKTVATPSSALQNLVKDQGVRYHVVAIFGGQGTGKSTLLNQVFGTSFETMNETLGRPQTTRGAFLSASKYHTKTSAHKKDCNDDSALFIMDFEGTDGVERGEDQSFERQLSLFALSCADTVIVNMRTTDVGRHNAANIPLLRTIFQVNLQLFCHDRVTLGKEKPTLCVVLRDFGGSTKFDVIVAFLKTVLYGLWDGISKPEGLEHCQLEQLFHLRFSSLPHFEYEREEFDQSCVKFRSWFTDQKDSNYIFESADTFRAVPLEGLPCYLSNCWQAIQKSKDLNIPSQREMLARHRCIEYQEATLQSFAAITQFIRNKINRGELFVGIVEQLNEKRDAYANEFYDNTKLYSASVALDFKSKILTKLADLSEEVVRLQCRILANEVLLSIDADVHSIVDDAVKETIYKDKALQLGTPGTIDVNEHVRSFWRCIERGAQKLTASLADPASSVFGRFQPVVEKDAACRGLAVQLAVSDIREKLRKRMEAMTAEAAASMHRAFEYSLNHNLDGSLRLFVTPAGVQGAFPAARFSGIVLLSCIFYFRLRVVNEDDGMLRQTSSLVFAEPDGDAQRPFFLTVADVNVADKAPQYPAIPHRNIYATMDPTNQTVASILAKRIDDDDDDERPPVNAADGFDATNVLMSRSAVSRAYDLYEQQCQFTMLLQVRSLENGQAQIPMWMWGLVVFLGHQEFVYVITSPVLILFTVIIGYVFFKKWIALQYQRFEETGPPVMVAAAKTVVGMLQPILQQLHDQAQSGPAQQQPQSAKTSHVDPTASNVAKKQQ